MRSTRILYMAVLVAVVAFGDGASAKDAFEPTWESLHRHETPEWFRDAKFGIYTHWGPVTVGAEDGPDGVQWYGRSMYVPASPTFEYHRKKYGDPNQFGYKDIIGLFAAEKFDAEAWAELFAQAGAKFAGPVAIHHDNYAMWDSRYTRWDSMDQCPKRDFVAELEKAVREHGMKYITTFHHAFAWEYYEPAYKFDAGDGAHADLYGEPHEPGTSPSKAYLDRWLAMVNEVVVRYEPDLTWFDFGLGQLIPSEYQRQMFADYYNWAARRGIDVGVAHKHQDIHEHTGILDFERGREDRLTPYPWLTDTSIGPWFHQKSTAYKSADEIVDVLVDIVSKNGCMLLNVGPAADGTIPADAQALLQGIGRWLRVNGEAIYNTRPWLTFGEGPTRNSGGGFSENKDKPYTAHDVRFTRSKDDKTVYVILLGRPAEEVTIRSIHLAGQGRVHLLGSAASVPHRTNDASQLVIAPPPNAVGEHAFVYRLEGFQIELHPEARFTLPGAVALAPAKAMLEGGKIKTQVNEGRENIGFWDHPGEKIHWLVRLDRPGAWQVRGEFSCAGGPSGLTVTLANQSATAKIPRTDSWFRPVFVDFGGIRVDEPGVYHLSLAAAEPSTWKAVNVYQLQLAPLP